MKTDKTSSIRYSCTYCNKEIPEQIRTLQETPDASKWVKSGFCSLSCFNGMNEATQEEKITRVEESGKTNKQLEASTLEEKKVYKSKPSEFKTFGRELADKAVGQGQIILGNILLFVGLIAGIALIVSEQPEFSILGFLLSLIGLITMGVGAQKKRKAQFIAWTMEALERFERMKSR